MDTERIVKAARDVEREYRSSFNICDDRHEAEILWHLAESWGKFANRLESGEFPYHED